MAGSNPRAARPSLHITMPEELTTKWCNRCKQRLPLTDFSKNRHKPDGLSSYCKSCSNAIRRAWQLSPAGLARNARRRKGEPRIPQPKDRSVRRCPACSTVKSVSEFHKSDTSSSGLQSKCKSCRSAANVARGKDEAFKAQRRARNRVEVSCGECDKTYTRFKNSHRPPLCRSCASKARNSSPEYKEGLRARGRAQILRQGRIPNDGSIRLRGADNPNWRGGLPDCKQCGKRLSERKCKLCRKCSAANLQTPEVRARCYANRPRGEKHPCWKGGKERWKIRKTNYRRYRRWRELVLERDNYTCVLCGVKRTDDNPIVLHVDHIQPYILRPDLVTDLDNGRALCVPCHKATPTYGIKARTLKKRSGDKVL